MVNSGEIKSRIAYSSYISENHLWVQLVATQHYFVPVADGHSHDNNRNLSTMLLGSSSWSLRSDCPDLNMGIPCTSYDI